MLQLTLAVLQHIHLRPRGKPRVGGAPNPQDTQAAGSGCTDAMSSTAPSFPPQMPYGQGCRANGWRDDDCSLRLAYGIGMPILAAFLAAFFYISMKLRNQRHSMNLDTNDNLASDAIALAEISNQKGKHDDDQVLTEQLVRLRVALDNANGRANAGK